MDLTDFDEILCNFFYILSLQILIFLISENW